MKTIMVMSKHDSDEQTLVFLHNKNNDHDNNCYKSANRRGNGGTGLPGRGQNLYPLNTTGQRGEVGDSPQGSVPTVWAMHHE